MVTYLGSLIVNLEKNIVEQTSQKEIRNKQDSQCCLFILYTNDLGELFTQIRTVPVLLKYQLDQFTQVWSGPKQNLQNVMHLANT